MLHGLMRLLPRKECYVNIASDEHPQWHKALVWEHNVNGFYTAEIAGNNHKALDGKVVTIHANQIVDIKTRRRL